MMNNTGAFRQPGQFHTSHMYWPPFSRHNSHAEGRGRELIDIFEAITFIFIDAVSATPR
jgi:hypothetical protein